MRAIALATLLVASLLPGCASWKDAGERAVRDTERDRLYGAPRPVSYDLNHPERDWTPSNGFRTNPF